MPVTYHCRLKAHGETRNGTKIDTGLHYDYIAREGKYANIRNHGEDLRFKKQGNIPPWANNRAGNYWKAAEEDRIKKESTRKEEARAYREFELGLQMDLSLDDNIECIDEFLKRTGISQDHTYSYSIHERPARNDEDLLNIHTHIMFDERIIEHDRPINSKEDYFKRHSKKKDGSITGGYKKDKRLNSREFLLEARKIWADIVNEKLKQRGLDEQVSHKTLEEQQKELRQKGEHKLANTMNREPAPKMEGILKNPQAQELIKEKIKFYEEGNIDDKPLEEMPYVERCIAHYAKDYVIRRAARKIQLERMKEKKDFSEALENQEAEELRTSPVVITVGDIQDYFHEKIFSTETEIQKNKQLFMQLKKSIVKEEYIRATVLRQMTDNRYSQLYKAYMKARDDYKKEAARENEMLHSQEVDAQEKYIEYSTNLRKMREHAIQLKNEFKTLQTNCLETRKEEYESITEKIKSKNQETEKQIRATYGKIKAGEKEIETYKLIQNDFEKLDPETILFSEELPRQLSRKDRINGTTPIKKLEACAYKGNIYYIIDGENEKVKAVRLNDDVTKGKVPVYEITRVPNDEGKYKVVRAIQTNEQQKLYKERPPKNKTKPVKPKPKALQKAEGQPTPKTEKAIEEQRQRTELNLEKAAEKLIDNATPRLHLRWQEKDEHKLNEMEEAEKRMYEGWHPAYPPRTK